MSKRDASISPPPKRRRVSPPQSDLAATPGNVDDTKPVIDLTDAEDERIFTRPDVTTITSHVNDVSSPFQLNFIQEFPASSNVDAVSLGSILGDPLIKECWLFNYLFDAEFILRQFDVDVRRLVKIKLVHGSWRREDSNGVGIEEAAKRHPNIQNIKAYMPEAYGTHHSKMIILFRHDDVAQVIIMTGNLIERDWSMSQAFWCSPLLPPLPQAETEGTDDLSLSSIGSGQRFKHDLLAYIRAYGSKLSILDSSLRAHDFGAIRAAFVASVPSKIRPTPNLQQTVWGLPALSRILSTIPSNAAYMSHIVTQVSSVASVGDKWLTDTFFPTLSATSTTGTKKPKQSIIFPTVAEIRNSIDGYASGGSIHMKTSTPPQQRQLEFLRPMLCHWGPQPDRKISTTKAATPPQNSSEATISTTPPRPAKTGKANRHPAAPHIKTYIRFSNSSMRSIDWAMLTSANLSTQAWGTTNPQGECRICSYEVGVVIWPDLFRANDDESGATMAPVFKSNAPTDSDIEDVDPAARSDEAPELGKEVVVEEKQRTKTVVGLRMPYSLPLYPYGDGDEPWCATANYREPDWMGRRWMRGD